jgi:hypothetical protein
VYLLALVIGLGGAALCALVASSLNGFALAFAVAVVTYCAFSFAHFNRITAKAG